MEPISTALGLVSSITGIATFVGSSIHRLSVLTTRYKQADVTTSLLLAQLCTVQAALNQLGNPNLTGHLETESGTSDWTISLATSLDGCQLIITSLHERLDDLETADDGGLAVKGKMLLLWRNAEMKDFLDMLDRQVNALNLLLQVVQCQSIIERHHMLIEKDNATTLKRARDCTESLLAQDSASVWSRPKSIISRDTANFSQVFDFDHQLLHTRVYNMAIRNNFRQLVRKEGTGRQEQHPPVPPLPPVHHDGTVSFPPTPLKPIFSPPQVVTSIEQGISDFQLADDWFDSLPARNLQQNEPGSYEFEKLDDGSGAEHPKDISALDNNFKPPTEKVSAEEVVKYYQEKPPTDEVWESGKGKPGIYKGENQLKLVTEKTVTWDPKVDYQQFSPSRSNWTSWVRNVRRRRQNRSISSEESSTQPSFRFVKDPSIEFKVLLLGSLESGKSTISKAMRSHFESPFSVVERRDSKELIYSNILSGLQVLIDASESRENLQEKPREESDTERAKQLISSIWFNVEDVKLDGDLVAAIKSVWAAPDIQDIYAHDTELSFPHSTSYYIEQLDRIAAPDYIPTYEDMLMIRLKTTGITERVLRVKSAQPPINWRLFDTGGARSERKKWIHCFDNVDLVIFPHDIACYDQKLFEDRTANRLEEDLKLWESLVTSRWLTKTPFLLLFTKVDLLAAKLAKSPVSAPSPEYGGNVSPAAYRTYIASRFLDLCPLNMTVEVCFASVFPGAEQLTGPLVYEAGVRAMERHRQVRERDQQAREMANYSTPDLLSVTRATPPANLVGRRLSQKSRVHVEPGFEIPALLQ